MSLTFFRYTLLLVFLVSQNLWAEQAIDTDANDTQILSSVPENSPASYLSSSVIDERPEVISSSRVLIQVVTGLGAVTLLIFVLAWLAKKLGYANFNGPAHMRVVANLPLGNRERAVLIEVEGERLVLGVAPGRVNVIKILEARVSREEYAVSVNDSFPEKNNGVPLKKGQEFARYLKSVLDPSNKS
ncbi:flagellar biosynthetic protein FliO [Teredinibacter purpureus]|uniref:flagellar biosynthetic protein FliO n=1 Tax=Teredinibacter purpureus TaxID=2731756 RepID=UPI0006978558|nr:flagellar biosynthetic protein FliO [Teredinibacter purpureus]